MPEQKITKILSANDTGDTGTHQAGMLVPKDPKLLSFFPSLDPALYNPRVHLNFIDSGGTFWEFAFIYYNSALFGGTRNEFRLTRMTKYVRQAKLVAGDELTLTKSEDRYGVSHTRQRQANVSEGVLHLGNGWRIVNI